MIQNMENIFYANILICVFNLLPIYPLDGGRILNSVFNIKIGVKESMIITNKIMTVMNNPLFFFCFIRTSI